MSRVLEIVIAVGVASSIVCLVLIVCTFIGAAVRDGKDVVNKYSTARALISCGGKTWETEKWAIRRYDGNAYGLLIDAETGRLVNVYGTVSVECLEDGFAERAFSGD